MYNLKRICLIIWVCLVLFSTAAHYNPANGQLPDLVILSTNDRHSSFLGEPYPDYDPTNTGDGTMGGIARLKSAVDEIRAENPNTLLFDAGDFMDGTMFVVAENGAADLNIMREVGYNAACLGNHEFTYGPDGLAAILKSAKMPIIPLLSANISFGAEKSDDALEALWGDSGDPSHHVYPSVVLTTESGVKVGVFGLLWVPVQPDRAENERGRSSCLD